MDLYEKLHLDRSASIDDIKKSYKKLAREHHPDKTNGDKESEDKFKEITDAYSILTDPVKKEQYDKYGKTSFDDNGMQEMDISGMFQKMMFGGGFPGFGGDGFPGFGGVGGDDGFTGFRHHQPPSIDIINIDIDINDIYYGNTKHVEFEVNDICPTCKGIGATDPSAIVKCHACKGEGSQFQQLGPFMMKATCSSCMGKCQIIKNGKACTMCSGKKTCYVKRKFDLKIPKGIPNKFEIKMPGKGAYDLKIKKNNDIVFVFTYNIEKPYKIESNGDVSYQLNITIDDLLGGFNKHVLIYNDTFVIKSKHYFNPTKKAIIKGKGIKSSTNLIIDFNVIFSDSVRLEKYRDVLCKVVNVSPDISENKDVSNEYIIQNILQKT